MLSTTFASMAKGIRLCRERRLECLQGVEETHSVEGQGGAGEGGVAGCASPDVGQNDEEGEDRDERPAEGRPREETGERGGSGGDEDREEEGVVEPAERLRIHDAELDEQAQREVQEEYGRGGEEDRGRNTNQTTRLPLLPPVS